MIRLRSDMSWGVVCSLVLHGIVILLGLWGFSFWDPTPPELPRPIPIDVVTVDQISQAPRPKPKPEKKPLPPPEKKPVEKPEEKPAPPEKPEPLIQADEKKQPPLPQEKPQEDKNPSEVPPPSKPKEEPKVEKKPEKKEKKPDKKPEKKKEDVKKKKADEAQKKKKKDFLSVLKNLESSEEEEVSDSPEPDLNSDATNAGEKISDHLSISEIDLIKRQLMECWNVPAGAKDVKDLIIVLDLTMNPDGTVKEASVVSGKSSRNHPFYQAGAESALRAIRNPRCTPLKLPPDRYASWKTFEITFNPKNVR